MDQNVVPVQNILAKPSVLGEWHPEHDPIWRVRRTRLRLADERLAGPTVGVPQGKPPVVPFACLELKPRQDEIRNIGRFQPGILVGQN
jgi:hypothetical protein